MTIHTAGLATHIATAVGFSLDDEQPSVVAPDVVAPGVLETTISRVLSVTAGQSPSQTLTASTDE